MAQEQIPLTAVIVDDGGYGMLRYDQALAGATTYGVDLHTPDFAALARRASACAAETVDGLDDAFGEALARHVADPAPSRARRAHPDAAGAAAQHLAELVPQALSATRFHPTSRPWSRRSSPPPRRRDLLLDRRLDGVADRAAVGDLLRARRRLLALRAVDDSLDEIERHEEAQQEEAMYGAAPRRRPGRRAAARAARAPARDRRSG